MGGLLADKIVFIVLDVTRIGLPGQDALGGQVFSIQDLGPGRGT